jgi:thiol-disulfide isomerase/thioredoxin
MRAVCWPIIGLVLVAMVSLGASCDGGRRGSAEPAHADEASGTRPAGKNRVESIAAIDVSQLTDPERRVWVDLINDLLSPCGDPISVGACAASGSAGGAKACGACVTAARYLARLVAEGYERIEIEEHYNTRFGRDTQKRFALDSTPVRGAPMAPITIVEFSDFECPYCGAAHPLLKETLREFEGKVRLAFKHYPLPSHPRAVPAALAAEAARMQGKFWEMHDLLFANRGRRGSTSRSSRPTWLPKRCAAGWSRIGPTASKPASMRPPPCTSTAAGTRNRRVTWRPTCAKSWSFSRGAARPAANGRSQ